MEYNNSERRLKRNAIEASLEDLEMRMASLSHDKENLDDNEQVYGEITSQKDNHIYSSHALHSYLNPTQSTAEVEDEQLKLLQKSILEEKSCPNILPFQAELNSNLCEIVDNQEQAIKDAKQTLENKLFLNIYSLELERIKYLLKSYLRIRLFKIQKFATYIIRQNLERLLSKQEQEFLKQFIQIKHAHFKENLLDHLPGQFRNLGLTPKNEASNGEYMVSEPDLDKTVIVKVVRRFESFTLDVNANSQDMNLIPGEIYCFRYKDIKNLHEMGFVEFI